MELRVERRPQVGALLRQQGRHQEACALLRRVCLSYAACAPDAAASALQLALGAAAAGAELASALAEAGQISEARA